jgi:hypothetical protein
MDRPLIRIDRNIWLRGVPNTGELHRASDGKMCCIGIACAQLGTPIEMLTGRGTVGDLLGDGNNEDTTPEIINHVPSVFKYSEDVIVENEADPEYCECSHCRGHEQTVAGEITVYKETAQLQDAYKINDSDHLSDPEREEQLTPIFHSMGLNVEFFNG